MQCLVRSKLLGVLVHISIFFSTHPWLVTKNLEHSSLWIIRLKKMHQSASTGNHLLYMYMSSKNAFLKNAVFNLKKVENVWKHFW